MTFPPRVTACALVVSTLLSTTAAADEYFRQHEAHQHGVVEFNIAQDGQDLLLEITTPGADVVGFEHAPSNEQQQEAIKRAIEQLKQANVLFAFTPSANCRLTEVIATETLTGHDHENHVHDSHTGHDHDDHKHGSHAGHDHGDLEHDCHGYDHGEFSIQYAFHCPDIKQLEDLQVSWFKHFPSTEKIAVQAITEAGQKAEQLTPTNTKFSFN